jgi:DNA gyrase subunit A
MTANGIVLRTRVDGIRAAGRITRGVRVVNLLEGDTVAAVAVMTYADLNRGVDDGGETGADLALNGSESETSLPEVEGAPLLET